MTCPYVEYAEIPGCCDGCCKKLVGRQRRWCGGSCSRHNLVNHRWSNARAAARRRDRKCVTCGSVDRLEVNHIEPRNGQGYGWGCHNHLSNLETLCHTCHVAVTNRQREVRRG